MNLNFVNTRHSDSVSRAQLLNGYWNDKGIVSDKMNYCVMCTIASRITS